jgi:lipoprotein NlpI
MRFSVPITIRESRFATLAVTAALLLAVAAGAHGQADSDADLCMSVANNPDLAIQHCTRAIESRRYASESLGKLHHSRGVEWTRKRDFDRAIADFDNAIRLVPDFANAIYNRATAWANKGDPDRAIADYTATIRLSPREAAAHSGRGVEWNVKGDYAKAIADFDAAIGLDPKSINALLGRGRARFYGGDFQRASADFGQAHKLDDNAYAALWQYLALKRGSIDGDETLKPYAPAATASIWPAPVIALYIGLTNPEAVVAATDSADPAHRGEMRCEANFYVAQWHLIRGERQRALPLLKEARGGCPKNAMEYEGTLAELRSLQRR